ncbi:lipoprotein signal peptidase [Neptunitalea chrysea]|uniref:Lipoprotein signal peptidase n=1 Tax=Neptunitalea chrysea TaxID=1647581 RepID=A0A9W6B5Q7_9FLAO|nr:signal peptidase II [Neptunitalea chrysea]GLB53021.1 lipoprotein signal peptidase [Neptunitalea chrysea]
MKRTIWLKIILGLLLVIANVSCDQITKKHVRKNINTHEYIEVLNTNFVLTKIENTGAALSFGQHFSPTIKLIIFQLVPLIVLLGLFYYAIHKTDTNLKFVALTFIIGGGIGNIIDRVLYSSVTDFMYIEIGSLHTGIFNMADVSVTLGGITLLLQWFISSRKNLAAS